MDIRTIPTPSYVIDEGKLENNCKILSEVAKKAGCKILLAQKAYSAFATYPLIRRYLAGATASGLYEAKLGWEEMKGENHVFSPAYSEEEMAVLVKICDHISFNSIHQLEKHRPVCMEAGVSMGLRINPECSTQEHGIYDPCAPFSRLGVTRAMVDKALFGGNVTDDTKTAIAADDQAAGRVPGYEKVLRGVEGLHVHTLCEQNADALEITLKAFCEKFDDILQLPQIKWLNLGGGHHITREDYDRELLIRLVRGVKEQYNVEVYLEPGEAIALNAGYLVTEVMDIVENGMPILILDASAACHMP
ncbi:MAG: carboxynorspermidine decarboxylase, partial [Lachnospiraceae bacterium]|nr:carboxynorspermidine decarboxylase [Lachnospiraceae bacterium]